MLGRTLLTLETWEHSTHRHESDGAMRSTAQPVHSWLMGRLIPEGAPTALHLTLARRRLHTPHLSPPSLRPTLRRILLQNPGELSHGVCSGWVEDDFEPKRCGVGEDSTAVLSGTLLPHPSTTTPAHPPYLSVPVAPLQARICTFGRIPRPTSWCRVFGQVPPGGSLSIPIIDAR